jgi:release factor glutamine methyltransferase
MTGAVAAPSALALLRDGMAILQASGPAAARREAEWLLAGLLGVGRFDIYLEPARELSTDEARRYLALLRRRAAGEPLQHLLGFEEFHGLRLAVSPAVLIPRPETEGLVEWAIEMLGERADGVVADVGTGSGAIACALAARVPGLRVLALDCSPAALAVAADNVRAHGLADRVHLAVGDLLVPLSERDVRVDLVVANLPYLPSALIRSLPDEVAAWEPRLALDGGPDGMALLRRLVRGVAGVLGPGGSLLLEIGEEQAGPVASLMAAEGFAGIRSRRDLNGVERYIGGQWPAPGAAVPGTRC